MLWEPLRRRKEALAGVLQRVPADRIVESPVFPEHGTQLYQVAKNAGLEGIVAKALDSLYRPGVRSPAWRKSKNWQIGEFLVVGMGHAPPPCYSWRKRPKACGCVGA